MKQIGLDRKNVFATLAIAVLIPTIYVLSERLGIGLCKARQVADGRGMQGLGLGTDRKLDYARSIYRNTPIDTTGISRKGEPNEGAARVKRITDLIGQEDAPRWCQFDEVVERLEKGDVPILCELLTDNQYRNRWAQISHMITWISDEGDMLAYQAVVEYVSRVDSWDEIETKDARVFLYWKARVIGYMGLFKTDDAKSLLRDAFTSSGAEDLVENWVYLPHKIQNYNPEYIINAVRGHAAKGLILSRSQENIQIVREKLEAYYHEILDNDHSGGQSGQKAESQEFPYTYLSDAMAQNDLIEQIGLSNFLRLEGKEAEFQVKLPFLKKYHVEDSGNGELYLIKCPICGRE